MMDAEWRGHPNSLVDDVDPWTSPSINFFKIGKAKNPTFPSAIGRVSFDKVKTNKVAPSSEKQLSAYALNDDEIDNLSFPTLKASVPRESGVKTDGESDLKPASNEGEASGKGFVYKEGPLTVNFPENNTHKHVLGAYESPKKPAEEPLPFDIDPRQRLMDFADESPSKSLNDSLADAVAFRENPMSLQRPASFSRVNMAAQDTVARDFEQSNLQQAAPLGPPDQEVKARQPSFTRINNTLKIKMGLLILFLLLFFFGIFYLHTHKRPAPPRSSELPIIEATSPIKIRPPKEMQMVPYQDELIYGNLDGGETAESEGEHIIPEVDFAPEPPVVTGGRGGGDDYLPEDVGAEANSEEAVDVLDRLQSLDYAEPVKKPADSISSKLKGTKDIRTPAAPPPPPQKRAQPTQSLKAKTQAKQSPAKPQSVPKNRATTQQQTSQKFLPLGTFPSKQLATNGLVRLKNRYPILKNHNICVQVARVGRNTIYKLMAGPFKKEEEMSALRRVLGRNP
jgi:cell division septation protein DedD